MRKLILALLAVILPADALGQGAVVFNNRVSGTVDARVILPDGNPAGVGWTAQLYGGPEGGASAPLFPATTFRTGPASGYVVPLDLVFPGVNPGTKVTLVMRVFNGASFETSTVRLESNPITIVLGGGTLPPANLGGLQNFKEVTIVSAPSFVVRELPAGYAPEIPLIVVLLATPSAGTSVYAVEDRPPAGWRVGRVSDGGKYDAPSGKVKFGPFFDATVRPLTYEITPPAEETGEKQFDGTASADGRNGSIGGPNKIDLFRFHPADQSPANSRITVDEATAYGGAWRKSLIWPVGPNPIPMDYATRAGTLWKNGETYLIDARISAPPLWWVNSPALGLASFERQRSLIPEAGSSSAVCMLPPVFVPAESLRVKVAARPPAGVSVYAVQDKPPSGWVVSRISHDGEFDSANQQVKWGPFYDGDRRDLSYEVIPNRTTAEFRLFMGSASFDGRRFLITGQRQTRATSRLGPLKRLPSGEFQIQVSGRLGATYRVEVSIDLVAWSRLASQADQEGRLTIADPPSASAPSRFYRTVAE